MPVFDDEDHRQETVPQPKGMWSKPELEETPSIKAVLKGFDEIGQPYHDQPSWRKNTPEVELPDFNAGAFEMPKTPDTSDLYKSSKIGFMQHAGSQQENTLGIPESRSYKASFDLNSSNRLVDDMSTHRENMAFGDDLSRAVEAQKLKMASSRAHLQRMDQIKAAQKASAQPTAANKVSPVAVPTSTTNRYPENFDDELVRKTEAEGMGQVGNLLVDGIAGGVQKYGPLATSVMHGDHIGQSLTNTYSSDPERYSTRIGETPEVNHNSLLQPISDNREAQGAGVIEDGINLHKGLNLSKDKRLLNLRQMLFAFDNSLKLLDSRHQPRQDHLGEIRRLEEMIAAGQQSDPKKADEDFGETMQRLRGSFYKDVVGQQLVDVIESLATGNASLALTGFKHAAVTASEMYTNEALANGEGDLIKALDYGGGNAMKTTAFRRSMKVLGDAMPPKTRALFGVVVDAMVNDMRDKAVKRVSPRSTRRTGDVN
ncbi:hypothetical protein NB640_01695 [Oxalobacter vibrioformis]|uniref:Uncharacterized protein n=1 Tax=Oxalobacter vibrioformis TaxID=933080 RepID=A0A9E9LZA3_9BURK|nr:hypothetical protein [Oxalobacter vibrioformis]WAW10405.1 hypothetical protein NB640_01695 [Oxalobacter vibrioformis]